MLDPFEGRLIPGLSTSGAQGQARLRLDDRQRRSKLVGRIGRELQLALPGELDGRRDPPADGDGADEDRDEEERPDEQLGEDERGLRLRDAVEGLGHDHVVVARGAPGDAHLDAADGRGLGAGDVQEVGRQRRIRRRRHDHVPIGLDRPDQQLRAVQGTGPIGWRRLEMPAALEWSLDVRQVLDEAVVDLAGEIPGHEDHHRDGDDEIGERDEPGRRERDTDRQAADVVGPGGGHTVSRR